MNTITQDLGKVFLNDKKSKFLEVKARQTPSGNWTVVCIDNNNIEWFGIKKITDNSDVDNLDGDYKIMKVNKHRINTPQYKKVNRRNVVIRIKDNKVSF